MPEANTVEEADRKVARAVAPARHSTPVKLLGTLSEIADQPQLITVCAVMLAAGLVRRDARLARTGARMLAAELLATAIKSAVKHRVDRTRPRVVDDGGDYRMQPGTSHDSDDSSFPSGHTAGAVSVAGAIGRGYPELRTAAYSAAAVIAVVQIPRCQHYASDLLAGALIGFAAEAAVHAVEQAVFPMPAGTA